jgi:hypothetical protein
VLIAAIGLEDYELVKLLVERGAQVNADRPWTALAYVENDLSVWFRHGPVSHGWR